MKTRITHHLIGYKGDVNLIYVLVYYLRIDVRGPPHSEVIIGGYLLLGLQVLMKSCPTNSLKEWKEECQEFWVWIF